jgi:hypothetical protein
VYNPLEFLNVRRHYGAGIASEILVDVYFLTLPERVHESSCRTVYLEYLE